MAIGGPTRTAEEPDDDDVDNVLEVRGVNVRFDMSRGQAWVLDDVDLDVRRNEIFAIAGESGAGKSTFAASLLDSVEEPGVLTGEITYYPEDADRTTVDDVEAFDVAGDDSVDLLELPEGEMRAIRWEEIAMVFQGATKSFNPTMKIKSHFHETVRAHNAVLDEQMAHVRELFDALHLDYDRVMDAYPHELSGGMKQRALVALALVLEPDVLVMDEPTAALDLLMQQSIVAMMKDLQEEFDLTIVFVTHDLPLIAGLADRIGVMYAFQFVEVGTTDELLEEAAHPYTRALLRSLPSIDSDIDEMETITGAQPDPINIPTGCSYHPRCPVADDRCEIEEPELTGVGDAHEAACFYADQARNEIEYTLHAGVTEDEG